MIMVGEFRAMTLIRMQDVHDVFMGMTVIFDLELMVRQNLGELGKVMRVALLIRRQKDARGQYRNDNKAQEY